VKVDDRGCLAPILGEELDRVALPAGSLSGKGDA